MKIISNEVYQADYLTLDDSTILAAASEDSQGFVSGFEDPVIIDEVQRVPDLFLAIKAEVDTNRTPGKFLLTRTWSLAVRIGVCWTAKSTVSKNILLTQPNNLTKTRY